MKSLLFFINLCILLSLTGQILNAKEPHRKGDFDEDYLIVSGKEKEPSAKKQLFKIYDNTELRGEPIFLIKSNELIDSHGQSLDLSSLPVNCNSDCKDSKKLPYDFLRIYKGEVAIAIKNYSGEKAVLSDKGREFYFSVPETPVDMRWRTFYKNEKINKIINSDASFDKFHKEIEACVKLKKISCLKNYFSSNLDEEKLIKRAKNRLVYDDKKLCSEFSLLRNIKGLPLDEIPSDILNKVSDINFIFDKIEKNFTCFDRMTIKNFGKNIILNSKKDLESEGCLGQGLDFWAQFVKEDNVWKINDMDFSAFRD